MESEWRIELLGGVRAVCGDTVIDRFRTQKTAALLGYLAFPPGRARSRDEVVTVFWPDDELQSARHKLSVALHALRQQLEPAGVAEGAVLRADRFSVSLSGETRTDVQDFEEALRDAERASTDAERARHLTQAIETYGGEFLDGLYDSWIFPEQRRLSERFAGALKVLIRLREASGDLPGAFHAAAHGIAADPLREEFHREVMRLHLLAGCPAEALRQYALLETRLREDLDTAPSAATRELYHQARAGGEGAAAPAETPGASPSQTPRPTDATAAPEPAGGAVPLTSPYYVERRVDGEFREALGRGDSIILLKGPRQSGKTSLLARGLQTAREAGAAVVFTDFQGLNADHLAGSESLLLALAEDLCEQLDLDVNPGAAWSSRLGASPSFRRFMRREVLGKLQTPIVWGLDQMDLLLTYPYSTEIFGLFRSWHNERALDPSGPWGSLTMAVSYATEAHLFISDLNQSLFNVGTRLYLADFDFDHLADLNRSHGSPLRAEGEIGRLFDLVGGHPYLVRCAFRDLVTSGAASPLERLEAQADRDEGVFSEPLRRILLLLRRHPELCQAAREVLHGRRCPTLDSFYRLRSAGVLAGDSMETAQLRCGLFARFLDRHLA